MARIALLIVFMVAGGSAAWAEDPFNKLGRGFANMVTAPVEIINGVGRSTSEKGLIVGPFEGLAHGIGLTFRRAAAGIIEVFTFPFPGPTGDYEPLVDPEFVFDSV